MNLEDFDYGSLNSSSPKETTRDDVSGIFGPFDAKPQQSTRHRTEALNIRVAVQVVVAVILLLLAGVLLARETWRQRTRDSAMRQINEARSRADYLSVIQASEKFLTNPSTKGVRDEREATVINLYGEALVHWVAQYPTKLDASAHERIARYKQLTKTPDN